MLFVSLVFISSFSFAQNNKPLAAKPAQIPVAKPTASTVNNDAMLFSYGGKTVSVKEFLSVYKKNNVGKNVDYSEKSLKDYLKLYENFKLKVTEGRNLKIDTLPSLHNELVNYRKQLAKNYLMDKEVLERMYKEAYSRSLWELHVAHIMVKCAVDASPKDTLEAYNKIQKIYESVAAKNEDFSAIAKLSSDDNGSKNNGGDVGYLTALQAFYPFENAAYSLNKAGEISKPFRTKVGYHVIKLIEKRPTHGQVQVEHILVSVAKAGKPEAVDAAKKKIDNYYNLLKSGKANFETLAHDSSDDKMSSASMGKLPWFGTGKMVQEFEDQAFKLKTKGEMSAPFRTDYGFHIVKLLDRKAPTTYEKEKEELKKIVEKDARAENAKTVFLNGVKKDYKFTTNPSAFELFKKMLDSSLLKGTYRAMPSGIAPTLFSIDNKKYTTNEFGVFLENAQRSLHRNANSSADIADKAYTNWIDKTCNDLAEEKLEIKYPEFKILMDEYADGIILFDITDKNVWSKAVNDTAGLKAYYNSHKEKYNWASRMDAIIYRCANQESADEVRSMLLKNIAPDSIQTYMNKANKKSGVSFESGKYEKGGNKIIDLCKAEVGIQTVISDKIPCVVHVKNIVAPMPKMLEEARGYVIADYQEQLEKNWLNNLHIKYPIVEDEKVFKSLIK